MKTRQRNKGIALHRKIMLLIIAAAVVAVLVSALNSIINQSRYRFIRKVYCERVEEKDPNQLPGHRLAILWAKRYFTREGGGPMHKVTKESKAKFIESMKKELRKIVISEAMIEETVSYYEKALDLWMETADEVKKERGW